MNRSAAMDRILAEPCAFCGARAGQRCVIVTGPGRRVGRVTWAPHKARRVLADGLAALGAARERLS